jgi:TRAP-type C4-dicarboxylate transport system substrate-binding protein
MNMKTTKQRLSTACALVVIAACAPAGELKLGVPFKEGSQEWKLAVGTNGSDPTVRGLVKLVAFPPSPDAPGFGAKIWNGDLDGGLLVGKDLADRHRDALAYALPFTFQSEAQVKQVRQRLDADFLQRLGATATNHPFAALAIVEFGFAYVISAQPLASLEDWHQRKIWMPGEGDFARSLGQLGLKVVSTPLNTVRAAFDGGTVDTVVAPPPMAVFQRWHTKTKRMFDLPFAYTYGIWVVRSNALAGLTVREQETLHLRLTSISRDLETTFRKRNEDGRKVLDAWKHEFVTPNPAMRKQWETWWQELWHQLRDPYKPTPEMEDRLKMALGASAREKP